MKIRRRSHPHNKHPLNGKKEDRSHQRRMGRTFGQLLNTWGEVIVSAATRDAMRGAS